MEKFQREIWRDVVGYEDLYQVSSFGRVKNSSQEVLSPGISRGYYSVGLTKNGVSRSLLVHRLVALAFIYNDNIDKNEINHKDENKLNNRYTNLEWCTHKYNMNYGTIIERTKQTRIRKKLKLENGGNPIKRRILQLRNGEVIKKYNSIGEAARELGTCNGNISKCLKGQLLTCCGYNWEYEELKTE